MPHPSPRTRSRIPVPLLHPILDRGPVRSGAPDSDGKVRYEAIQALRCLQAADAIPGLADWLSDPDEWIRIEALRILGSKGAREAIPGLLTLLENQNSSLRAEAAQLLAKCGAKEAIPMLLSQVRK